MISKVIHFIWLTPPGGREFNIHHMVSVRSAHFFNPDYKIKFHCDKIPGGTYFEQIKSIVEISFVETPEEVFGIPVKFMANKADVARLRILIAEGGVYLDQDIITMRSYDDLLQYENSMGYELSDQLNMRQIFYFLRTFNFDVIKYRGRVFAGLCNGFIMAEKGSVFLHDWYEEYRNYNNDTWSYFSVKLPYLMLKKGKYNIHTISPYLSHFPTCWPDDLKLIFEKNISIPGKYFLHTWESKTYEKYLKPLTKDMILSADNTYCNAIKQFV